MPQIAPKKASFVQKVAIFFSLLVIVLFGIAIAPIFQTDSVRFLGLSIFGLIIAILLFRVFTKKYRLRSALLKQPFPSTWRHILLRDVLYYNTLSEQERHRFEQNVQIFLAEKRITGIKTEVDDQARILVAASAIIPIFGFREWEYDNLGEVLIYPGSFTADFRQSGKGRRILGMVGGGSMNRIMILSKPALVNGFLKAKDALNTGIHEFIHLIDGSDGAFDGIPHLMDKQYVLPWLDTMHKEIARIKSGNSKLRPYGATNKTEFFAVAGEYFFERPQEMEKYYPDLYHLLEHIFNQDMSMRWNAAIKTMFGFTGRRLGRNSLCPCGSGKKYKRCCLRNG